MVDMTYGALLSVNLDGPLYSELCNNDFMYRYELPCSFVYNKVIFDSCNGNVNVIYWFNIITYNFFIVTTRQIINFCSPFIQIKNLHYSQYYKVLYTYYTCHIITANKFERMILFKLHLRPHCHLYLCKIHSDKIGKKFLHSDRWSHIHT